MPFDWQNVIVLIAVAAAGAYIARATWLALARRKNVACGGCPKCAAADREPPLVGIHGWPNSRPPD